jgi:hypothetical protein
VKRFLLFGLAALAAFIVLAVATDVAFGGAIGKEFGPICTVGFAGDHAKDTITFRGWDAQSLCRMEVATAPGAFYNHRDGADPKALVVCNVDSRRVHATLRDTGSIGTDEFTVCDDIRRQLSR